MSAFYEVVTLHDDGSFSPPGCGSVTVFQGHADSPEAATKRAAEFNRADRQRYVVYTNDAGQGLSNPTQAQVFTVTKVTTPRYEVAPGA